MTPDRAAPRSDVTYSAFGLRISSEIELPELPSRPSADHPDVEIRLGITPSILEGAVEAEPGITAAKGALLIDVDPARYLVRAGREIVVSPKPGASERDVRAFLLGSAIGAICHQRGLLPLHANAVEIDGKAIAFAGPSGSGKSTLAAYFRDAGRRVLCDDVCLIRFDATGGPFAWPGIPRIKLWSDALAAFGRGQDDLERVFGMEAKFSLPIPSDPSFEPLPLERVYFLATAEEGRAFWIRPLSGARALSTLVENVYRWHFAAPLGQSGAQVGNMIKLLNSTRFFSVERRWGFDVFHGEAELLERHIGGGVESGAVSASLISANLV